MRARKIRDHVCDDGLFWRIRLGKVKIFELICFTISLFFFSFFIRLSFIQFELISSTRLIINFSIGDE